MTHSHRKMDVIVALIGVLVATVAHAQIHYETDYGPAKDGSLDVPNYCPGYGNVGACHPLCGFILDLNVNGFDGTITFSVDVSKELKLSSRDSPFLTCDPVTGDLADYTTSRIVKNIQDISLKKIAAVAPNIPLNTTCGDFDNVGMCSLLCDFIQGVKVYKKLDYFVMNLKELGIISNSGDTTICDPITGKIYDNRDYTLDLANIRDVLPAVNATESLEPTTGIVRNDDEGLRSSWKVHKSG